MTTRQFVDVPDECAQFARLLTDMASRLANTPASEFDQMVTACLRELAEFLDFDHTTLMAFSPDGNQLRVTHAWAAEGIELPAEDMPIEVVLPWFAHQMRAGRLLRISSVSELPPEAASDREALLGSGLKSNLSIPLIADGVVVGVWAFGTFRAERPWPAGIVASLRLAAEIMALGLRRHRYQQELLAIARSKPFRPDERAGMEQTQRQRQLALHLAQARYNERRRVADFVSEDVMQVVAGVGMQVESMRNCPPGELPEAIDEASELVRQAMQKLRALAGGLPPRILYESGIVMALQWLARRMSNHRFAVEVAAADGVEPIGDDLRLLLYEAAGQLLDNAARHGRATKVSVRIERADGDVRLTVSDNGSGFDPSCLRQIPEGAFGLFGIKEQAEFLGGRLDLRSSPGQGATAVLTLPMALLI